MRYPYNLRRSSSLRKNTVRRRSVCENLFDIKRNRRQHDVFLFLIVFPAKQKHNSAEARLIKNNKTICDPVSLSLSIDSHFEKDARMNELCL